MNSVIVPKLLLFDMPTWTEHGVGVKTVSIRDLQRDTATVLGWVEDGESVGIRKRGKLVAVLSPPSLSKSVNLARPDFIGRLKAIYGKRALKVTATQLLVGERSDR